jgi:hypothetical protein
MRFKFSGWNCDLTRLEISTVLLDLGPSAIGLNDLNSEKVFRTFGTYSDQKSYCNYIPNSQCSL